MSSRESGGSYSCFIIIALIIGHMLTYFDRIDMKAYAENEFEEVAAELYADEDLNRLNTSSSGRLVLWKAYL